MSKFAGSNAKIAEFLDPNATVIFDAAWELSRTRGYQISRKLRHRIEHLFGEAKLSHGLGRARYRGLAKMNEQATLTAITQNLKRMVKFLNKPNRRQPDNGAVRPKSPFFRPLNKFLQLQSPIRVFFTFSPAYRVTGSINRPCKRAIDHRTSKR